MKRTKVQILEDLLVAERTTFTEEQATALRGLIRERNGLLDVIKNIVRKYQGGHKQLLPQAIDDAAAIISQASL